jgi:RecA/RadA recombinase
MNSQAFSKLAMMASQQKVALVYTTQLRANMNMVNPYMDPYETSSGGMALAFYASIRIRLHRTSKLK